MTTPIRLAAAYAAEWVSFQCRLRGVPGVQLAIRCGDELLVDVAFGDADAETGEALTTRHLFRVASHSKTFTATGVLQLVESGRLRLDDLLATWVPELEGEPVGGVSVRALLAHQSGVIRDGVDADFWQRGGGRFPDRAAVLELVREHGAVYEPYEHFKYSNVGYALLGLVIEAVSGQTYADYVDAHIVAPLGLTRTGPEWEAARAGEFAAGHSAQLVSGEPRRVVPHVDTAAYQAATGWYSTAAELSAVFAAHLPGDETLVRDASKRLLHRTESAVTTGAVRAEYGLGVDAREIGGQRMIGHSGGYPGHITRTWVDPEHAVVVSVLTNAIDAPADTLARGVLDILDLARAEVDDDAAPGAAPAPGLLGRLANLWGVTDLVDFGGGLMALDPKAASPTDLVVRLEPVAGEPDVFTTQREDGFWASGERARLSRDSRGDLTAAVISGMTSWPIAGWAAQQQAMTVAGIDTRVLS